LSDRVPFARVHAVAEGWLGRAGRGRGRARRLGPEYPHDPKALESKAGQAAKAILGSEAQATGANQNMLVFLAPDPLRLAELTDAAGQYLAWKSISTTAKPANSTLTLPKRSGRSQRDAADDTARVRVGETYIWLLVPEQSDGTARWPTDRQAEFRTRCAGSPGRAKLRNEELLIVKSAA